MGWTITTIMSVWWKGLNNNVWVYGETIWTTLENPTLMVDGDFCSLLFIDRREMF
jgi:hypothetical protein